MSKACDWSHFYRQFARAVSFTILSKTIASNDQHRINGKFYSETEETWLETLYRLQQHIVKESNMEFNNLKFSISQKSLYSLSEKRRSKIMKEVIKNVRLQYCKKCSIIIREPMNDCNMQEIPGPSDVSFTDNLNVINDYRHDIFDDLSSSSSLSSFDASFCETTQIESSFRERLASCFVDNNLTHVQGNGILHLLRTHPC